MKLRFYYFLLIFLSVFIVSCSDDNDGVEPIKPVETSGFFTCNEGVWNQLNSSSLSFYSFDESKLYTNYFSQVNSRVLGDTPNQMATYGSKMYCVVTGSGIIEVMNAQTGESIQQVEMKKDNGASKEPRQIAFYQGKAYICSFDNTVCRIDTASLIVDKTISIGNAPDGICVVNGKIYISNSGMGGGNTVSVIDVVTFTKNKDITVRLNPGKMIADEYGDVYVISKGDYTPNLKSCLQRIDSNKDELVDTFGFEASNFTICDDLAYVYSYEYDDSYNVINQKLISFDVKTETLLKDNFITDGTKLDIPYAISVNPQDKYVYVANVTDYTGKADILQFNPEGKLQKKIVDVGISPNSIVFVER